MLPKKKEDRIKSAQSNSPYSRKLKEGTSGGISNEGKPVRISIWPEWSEMDINNEKWDIPFKAKDKDKAKSPQMAQNLFDDPDGQLRLPPSLKVAKWRRSSEYFTKNPIIIDTEEGVHKFDIFTVNEHLFVSETMRWIMCQINNLWITSEKILPAESESVVQDGVTISSNGIYHSWKFWEHIFSLNKVGKGFPQYNPAGKYIVKLFWMGEWRKILVDDTLPFDENDQLLLPLTTLRNELWSVILSKALLKIASLSYNFSSNEAEFGDFSVIHSLTGWIPQKKVVSKEHQNQIWSYLSSLLHRWTYPNGSAILTDKSDDITVVDSQNAELYMDKPENKEFLVKDKSKKDLKDNKQKEKKEKEKNKVEKLLERKSSYENPETIILATYTHSYNKMKMLSTSNMANHSEALRKLGMPLSYSHPVLLNVYRDSPLIKCSSPELIPSWKLIRPLNKPDLPIASDCIVHDSCHDSKKSINENKDIYKFVEIQSPFLDYKLPLNDCSFMTDNADEDLEESVDTIINEKTFNCKTTKQINDFEVTKNSLNNNLEMVKTEKSLEAADQYNENEIKNFIDEHKFNFNKEMPKRWIDIDTFYECFEVIYVYHKTETYRYSDSLSDLKPSSLSYLTINSNSREAKRSTSNNLLVNGKKNKDILQKYSSDVPVLKTPVISNFIEPLSSDLDNLKGVNNDQKEPFYLYCDNIDNTEIIFCLSVFCKWFTTNEISYLLDYPVSRNSPSINIVKDGINNLEDFHDDNDSLMVDSLRGTFIAENHSWKSFKIGQCFKRARTNGVKAFCLKLPPGRHCLRIFIQAPNGFHCKLISQNPFTFGNEDEIMPLATEEPKRLQHFGINIISSLKNIITNFSNSEERKLSEKSFVYLLLNFNKKKQCDISTSTFTEVFHQSLLKVLNKVNKDVITPDMIFALRVLNLYFHSLNIPISTNKQNIISNRNSAKIPIISSKIDNRKQSSTKSLTSNEVKEEKTNEFIEDYGSFDILQIIRLQRLIRGFFVRKIVNARNSQSPFHNRVMTELNKLKSFLDQNTTEIGMNILNDIIDAYPQLLKHFDLENDKLNHIKLEEFKGNGNLQSTNGFGILFRDIFHIDCLVKSTCDILIKLNCSASKCCLVVINNDNGEAVTENVLKRLHLKSFIPNNYGYTLMAFVKDIENIVAWKLKLITGANNLLPVFTKQELCTDFSISKLRDYYLPEETGLLFQQMIKVKSDHHSTILVKLSNPHVPLRLSIFNFDEEVEFIEGIGEACLQSFIFFKDQLIEDQAENIGRSSSRNSIKFKKNKEKIDRYSAKNSGTNSSCSNEDNKIYKYSIQVFINPDNWSLSPNNEEFIDKLRLARRKNINENKTWNDSPSKIVPNSELSKKETSQKATSKAKGKDKTQDILKNVKNSEKPASKNVSSDTIVSRPSSTYFEFDKAHWNTFIISDTSLEDNIQISRNNEKYDNLNSVKRIWLEMDPLRFEKGKQIQLKYNEDNQYFQVNNQYNAENKQSYLDMSVYHSSSLIGNIANYQQSRYDFIDLFRQQQVEWNSWFQTERNKRNKKINNDLQVFNDQQKVVDSHRFNYFKNREKIKQSFLIIK